MKPSMAITDIGFQLYWTATATLLTPPHPEPVLVDRNWS